MALPNPPLQLKNKQLVVVFLPVVVGKEMQFGETHQLLPLRTALISLVTEAESKNRVWHTGHFVSDSFCAS